MTLAEQRDFFEDHYITELKEQVAEIKSSTEKVRKSIFGKHADVVKMLLEILHRVEQLEGRKDEDI